MTDIKCPKCNAETAPFELRTDDGEDVTVYRCLKNIDHTVIPGDGVDYIHTADRSGAPRRPGCAVLRCARDFGQIFGTDRPGRRVEYAVCSVHGAALDGGEPWLRGPENRILMGEDYEIEQRRRDQMR